MAKWFPTFVSDAIRISKNSIGLEKDFLDQFIFDVKRESLQVLRSPDELKKAVERVDKVSKDQQSFYEQFHELQMRQRKGWMKSYLPPQIHSEQPPEMLETQLSFYRRTLGKSIEERLPADLKADMFNRDWSLDSSETDYEKGREAGLRKGYEEGYQAALREFKERQRKKRKDK